MSSRNVSVCLREMSYEILSFRGVWGRGVCMFQELIQGACEMVSANKRFFASAKGYLASKL